MRRHVTRTHASGRTPGHVTVRHVTYRAASAAALLAAVLLATACGPADDETARSGASSPSEAGIRFEPSRLDLGRIVPGGHAAGSVMIRNATDAPVLLVELQAPCECTTADLELPRTLAPTESLELPVQLDLSQLGRGGLPHEDDPGPELLSREIEIRTDRGRATLPVVVELEERFFVKPVSTHLGNVTQGESATGTIEVGAGRALDSSARPLELLAPESADPRMSVEMRPVQGGTRLHLRWGPLEETGLAETTVEVQPALPDTSPVSIRVRANVLAPVSIQPSRIEVTDAPTDQPVVELLTVHSRGPDPVTVRGIGTPSHRIEYELLEDRGDGRPRIRVIVPVLPPPGEIDSFLFVDTDVPEVPRLTVPILVRGRASGPSVAN